MKTIYSQTASETSDTARISVLQNTLSQLRLSNIATLDGLMTHFTRLIELTSADEEYVAALATSLAPCILRPKTETSMTMEEKYSYRLIRDLFLHKDAIFSELKRASSLSHSISVDTRPRAISTDESNRKANMEARQRAIAAAQGSRSRASSPAPAARGHRRDRSSGGPETRFPISVASPTSATESQRGNRSSIINPSVRMSLEVPSESSTPVSEAAENNTVGPTLASITNGASDIPVTSATFYPGMSEDFNDIGLEKRNSLGRSAPVPSSRFAGRKPVRMSQDVGSNRDSVGSIGGLDGGRAGVSLTDKPMDD